MNGIGEEVRRLRKEKGWTQAQLAVYAGSSQPTINQIESGVRNPSTRTLEKIAGALDLEVRDLFPLGQASLPLEHVMGEAWQRGIKQAERDLTKAGPFYSPYEAQGRVLAGVWRGELSRWEEEIPAGAVPSGLAFGRLIGWVLSIGQSRDVYEDVAQEAGLTERDEMRDTLKIMRDVEREAVQMARRAFEPAKTYAEFRKIWEASGMNAIPSNARNDV